MHIRNYRFRPQLLPSLATAVLIPLFIHLGLWQAGKAERKTVWQATLDQRMRDAPRAYPADLVDTMAESENLRYLRVRVRGRYDVEHAFLLDNQLHQGRAGFHVITPLRLEKQAGLLLINRGWVSFSGDRGRLPAIATPEGEVEIVGHLMPPPVSSVAAEYLPAPGSWSLIWPSLDMPRLATSLGPLQGMVMRMDADSPGGGYLRAWERPDERIAMHRGYALQWFLLAGALALAWLLLSFRRNAAEAAAVEAP